MKKGLIPALIASAFVYANSATITTGAVRDTLLGRSNRILMPLNTRLDTSINYVAASETVYTKKFKFANRTTKLMKVAISDTNIVSQDTINIGDGVKIYQRLCFLAGNLFGFDTTESDTICDICGDSTLSAFVNAGGLSADSLICSTMDTTQMKQAAFLGDSMWVSKGYAYLKPDPGILFDYKIIGTSSFGATVKKVITMIWSYEGSPVWQDR